MTPSRAGSSQTSIVPVTAPVTVHRCPIAARSSTTVSRRSGHHLCQLARSATAAPTSTGLAQTNVSSAIWMLFIAPRLSPRTSLAHRPGDEWGPTRLIGDQSHSQVATTDEGAEIVREFSVPASFTVGEHDTIVSAVFTHE